MRIASLLLAATASAHKCRYARDYVTGLIYANETIRNEFIKDYLVSEAHYVRQMGTQVESGMARDGWKLNVTTGEPLPMGEHFWTASSKESIHIALLVKVLWGDPDAAFFYTVEEALQLLTDKITAMERFFNTYPGYGYYMPWVYLNADGTISPDGGWWYRTPALDNGEQLWPAWVLVKLLRERYPVQQDLADRWEVVVNGMLKNARKMFIENGKIRTEAWFYDAEGEQPDDIAKRPVDEITYTGNPNCVDPPGPCFLDDPYEGEMMTFAMELLDAGLTEEEKDQLWKIKEAKLQKATLKVSESVVFDVQKGWYSSSHEQWKYLMLPYRNSALNWEVFLNTERARTWYAAEVDPWRSSLWGAMAGVAAKDNEDGGYFGGCGIPEMSFQPGRTDIVTPYGAFSVVLASKQYGLAWLHNMMKPPRMQNCYGTTEGIEIDGRAIASVVTWDTKITTVMAVMGGIVDVMEYYMKKEGILDKFVDRVDKEWGRVFNVEELRGRDLGFRLPLNEIPEIYMEDWDRCVQNECQYPYVVAVQNE